ncbi:MAG: hypothetical protein ACRD2C_17535 [Acidimicrobiales bacterium]
MTAISGSPTVVARWVRLGLVALAVPQFVTGAWALVDASNWFDNFPGVGPTLVAAEPPFNAHLAADAGAGFLTTAVVLLLAAWWGDQRSVLLGLAGYSAFAIPHLIYHAANPAPGLSASEDVTNVVVLALGAAFPLLLVRGTLRHGDRQCETS